MRTICLEDEVKKSAALVEKAVQDPFSESTEALLRAALRSLETASKLIRAADCVLKMELAE